MCIGNHLVRKLNTCIEQDKNAQDGDAKSPEQHGTLVRLHSHGFSIYAATTIFVLFNSIACIMIPLIIAFFGGNHRRECMISTK